MKPLHANVMFVPAVISPTRDVPSVLRIGTALMLQVRFRVPMSVTGPSLPIFRTILGASAL